MDSIVFHRQPFANHASARRTEEHQWASPSAAGELKRRNGTNQPEADCRNLAAGQRALVAQQSPKLDRITDQVLLVGRDERDLLPQRCAPWPVPPSPASIRAIERPASPPRRLRSPALLPSVAPESSTIGNLDIATYSTALHCRGTETQFKAVDTRCRIHLESGQLTPGTAPVPRPPGNERD